MICKLCLNEKPLIKAHIIPNFLYKEIFNDDHFLYEVDSSSLRNRKKLYTGYFDKNIVCKECDGNIIGSYEHYASKSVFGKIGAENIVYREYGNGIKDYFYTNIDYTKFKLFLLSMLWKASVSNLSYCKRVNLGVMHEEAIRLMLLNSNPKDTLDYPVTIMKLENKAIPNKLIGDFVKSKSNAHTSYLIALNDYLFKYEVSKHNIEDLTKKTCIDKNNELVIPILQGNDALFFFDKYLGGNKIRFRK